MKQIVHNFTDEGWELTAAAFCRALPVGEHEVLGDDGKPELDEEGMPVMVSYTPEEWINKFIIDKVYKKVKVGLVKLRLDKYPLDEKLIASVLNNL